MPHAVPTTRRIKEGDIVLLDFGCKYKSYCSDMTRTIFVSYVEDEYKEAYDLVKELNEATICELKDGTNLKLVTKDINDKIKENRFSVMHSPGHGVGLDVHEEPFYKTNIDVLLKENMVITVEPGVYISGRFGIRIEDTVWVNKIEAKSLTKSSKEYVIIEG
ncbi:MAG: M24 family metallopeptidase [Clostridia bacterium]|nr:M24 family metallopeptidase [Clostridia bacterium]